MTKYILKNQGVRKFVCNRNAKLGEGGEGVVSLGWHERPYKNFKEMELTFLEGSIRPRPKVFTIRNIKFLGIRFG